MVKQQETEEEEILPSQGKEYLRLVGGKVVYISEAEVREEEVLAMPPRELSMEEILADELDCRIGLANQLRERIAFVGEMMKDDSRRPSRYEADYTILWYEYQDAIEDIVELDSRTVSEFRDRVTAQVRELEAKLSAMCDNWDPEGFDYFEQILARYETNFDLMTVLQKVERRQYGHSY